MYLLLLIVWFIFNGKITFQICLFGVLACAGVWLLLKYLLGWSIKKELRLYKLAPFIIFYALVLLWEILKANAAVIKLIFSRRKPEGVIVTFESGLRSPIANAALANSITLTPGTITVSEENGLFTVHCLCEDYAGGIDDLVFARLLRRMEGIA
ncbi:MAG: Na+/H+ antiporter subunit E [Oscillospiraceae bacterium]|nr:Na+/H+ antiporter subunit E [Oscillospiraceae bacterium]